MLLLTLGIVIGLLLASCRTPAPQPTGFVVPARGLDWGLLVLLGALIVLGLTIVGAIRMAVLGLVLSI